MAEAPGRPSLLIRWELPPEMLWPEEGLQADVYRVVQKPDGAHELLVEADSTWGVVEDREVSDLHTIHMVKVRKRDGYLHTVIQDADLLKYNRPAETCAISFRFTDMTGAPWTGAVIRVVPWAQGRESRGSFIARSNSVGQAKIFLRWGERARFEVDGFDYALECTIPRRAFLPYETLLGLGTKVDLDQRRSLGGYTERY